jgi:3'(2'), 5'-bisphosphate nucleotidase
VAIATVTAAAQLCQRVRRGQELMTLSKSDRSPVTVADLGAQAIICQAIAEAFPADAIVAEDHAVLLAQLEMAQLLQQVANQARAVMPRAAAAWINCGMEAVGKRF